MAASAEGLEVQFEDEDDEPEVPVRAGARGSLIKGKGSDRLFQASSLKARSYVTKSHQGFVYTLPAAKRTEEDLAKGLAWIERSCRVDGVLGSLPAAAQRKMQLVAFDTKEVLVEEGDDWRFWLLVVAGRILKTTNQEPIQLPAPGRPAKKPAENEDKDAKVWELGALEPGDTLGMQAILLKDNKADFTIEADLPTLALCLDLDEFLASGLEPLYKQFVARSLKLLEDTRLFTHAPPAQLVRLAHMLRVKTYGRLQYVQVEGHEVEQVCFVRSGQARLCAKDTMTYQKPWTLDAGERATDLFEKDARKLSRSRSCLKTLALLSQGCLFGLEGVLGDGTADWTVRAETTFSVLMLDKAAFKTLIGCLGKDRLYRIVASTAETRSEAFETAKQQVLVVQQTSAAASRQHQILAREEEERGRPRRLVELQRELNIKANEVTRRRPRRHVEPIRPSGPVEHPWGELPPVITALPPPPNTDHLPKVPLDSVDDAWNKREMPKKQVRPSVMPNHEWREQVKGRAFLVFSPESSVKDLCHEAVRSSDALMTCVGRAREALVALTTRQKVKAGSGKKAKAEHFAAIGVDMEANGAHQVLGAIRATPHYGATPVFALVPREAPEVPPLVQEVCCYVLLKPLKKVDVVREALVWCMQVKAKARENAKRTRARAES